MRTSDAPPKQGVADFAAIEEKDDPRRRLSSSYPISILPREAAKASAKRFWKPVRQPCDHPNQPKQVENDPLQFGASNRSIKAVNHALIARPWFIHQVWGPVSLVSKDTEVRSYRTDPVQVRSCPLKLLRSK
nr:hypothetical protein CFP56_62828 [Quercus suber]